MIKKTKRKATKKVATKLARKGAPAKSKRLTGLKLRFAGLEVPGCKRRLYAGQIFRATGEVTTVANSIGGKTRFIHITNGKINLSPLTAHLKKVK